MKNLILLCSLFTVTAAVADTDIVPLDIDSGYWLTKSELVFSKELDDLLASLPAERRDSMREMINSQSVIPDVKTCLSEEDVKEYDQQLLESMGTDENCDMTLKESTGTSFAGQYRCDAITASFSIKVLSTKKHVTEVSTFSEGVEQSKIRLVAEWQGNTCPSDAIQ